MANPYFRSLYKPRGLSSVAKQKKAVATNQLGVSGQLQVIATLH